MDCIIVTEQQQQFSSQKQHSQEEQKEQQEQDEQQQEHDGQQQQPILYSPGFLERQKRKLTQKFPTITNSIALLIGTTSGDVCKDDTILIQQQQQQQQQETDITIRKISDLSLYNDDKTDTKNKETAIQRKKNSSSNTANTAAITGTSSTRVPIPISTALPRHKKAEERRLQKLRNNNENIISSSTTFGRSRLLSSSLIGNDTDDMITTQIQDKELNNNGIPSTIQLGNIQDVFFSPIKMMNEDEDDDDDNDILDENENGIGSLSPRKKSMSNTKNLKNKVRRRCSTGTTTLLTSTGTTTNFTTGTNNTTSNTTGSSSTHNTTNNSSSHNTKEIEEPTSPTRNRRTTTNISRRQFRSLQLGSLPVPNDKDVDQEHGHNLEQQQQQQDVKQSRQQKNKTSKKILTNDNDEILPKNSSSSTTRRLAAKHRSSSLLSNCNNKYDKDESIEFKSIIGTSTSTNNKDNTSNNNSTDISKSKHTTNTRTKTSSIKDNKTTTNTKKSLLSSTATTTTTATATAKESQQDEKCAVSSSIHSIKITCTGQEKEIKKGVLLPVSSNHKNTSTSSRGNSSRLQQQETQCQRSTTITTTTSIKTNTGTNNNKSNTKSALKAIKKDESQELVWCREIDDTVLNASSKFMNIKQMYSPKCKSRQTTTVNTSTSTINNNPYNMPTSLSCIPLLLSNSSSKQQDNNSSKKDTTTTTTKKNSTMVNQSLTATNNKINRKTNNKIIQKNNFAAAVNYDNNNDSTDSTNNNSSDEENDDDPSSSSSTSSSFQSLNCSIGSIDIDDGSPTIIDTTLTKATATVTTTTAAINTVPSSKKCIAPSTTGTSKTYSSTTSAPAIDDNNNIKNNNVTIPKTTKPSNNTNSDLLGRHSIRQYAKSKQRKRTSTTVTRSSSHGSGAKYNSSIPTTSSVTSSNKQGGKHVVFPTAIEQMEIVFIIEKIDPMYHKDLWWTDNDCYTTRQRNEDKLNPANTKMFSKTADKYICSVLDSRIELEENDDGTELIQKDYSTGSATEQNQQLKYYHKRLSDTTYRNIYTGLDTGYHGINFDNYLDHVPIYIAKILSTYDASKRLKFTTDHINKVIRSRSISLSKRDRTLAAIVGEICYEVVYDT